MKLSEFEPVSSCHKRNIMSWDLAFVVGVLAIVGSCFIYDAQQEQAPKTNPQLSSIQ